MDKANGYFTLAHGSGGELTKQLGFHHIFNPLALDHLAFLVALSACYVFEDWRKVILLATSFTIGHSVTLALSVLDIVSVNAALIETLIPVTILIASFMNYFQIRKAPSEKSSSFSWLVLATTGFGLIHGLGFSNYLKELLGAQNRPVLELLSFNLGLEVGQVLIVLIVLLLNSLAIHFLKRRYWVMFFSGSTALVSTYILYNLYYAVG